VGIALAAAAHGQTTHPTTSPAGQVDAHNSVLERRALRRGDVPDGAESTRQSTTKGPLPASGLDLPRVLTALGIVVGLAVLLRFLARWLFPGVAAARSSAAVRVLSRSVITPKQQVLLVQVGRRVIVVGDTGAQMSPLAEITNEQEIAELVAQIGSERGASGRAFGSLFGRARENFDPPAETPSEEPAKPIEETAPARLGFASASRQIGELTRRIRSLSEHLGKD
jgi:flagellar biogenesis protein FliO